MWWNSAALSTLVIFIKTANNEWYDSVEEADKHYHDPKTFEKIMKEGFPKLNYEYAAQLLTKFDLRSEFA